ncbi:MAG TPA: CRTAC1 family protein, partial [Pyrinomonadaceae bacterium]|nr:CRTAC1 family protein [Pyrinomonadaceae bacterium]
ANDSTPNFHYRNNGDGTFKEIGFTAGTAVNENGSEQGCMGVTAGDYDHDGRLDIFITNFADEYNTLYHNDGKNSFTDLSYAAKVAAVSLPHVGWGTKFFDYDNDGWVDLFVANGHVYPQLPAYKQQRLLHRNDRDSTFSEISADFGAVLTETRASRGVAFGDIDNDGDVDLLIADLDGPPQLLRNDGANTNNSILIKTIGVKSNRDGIGARVTVVSGDLTQTDQVRSGDSYISQSDLRLHFGLEKRTKVDSIQVRWPSGTVDKIANVGVNRIITIKEGQGKVDEKEFIKQLQKGT